MIKSLKTDEGYIYALIEYDQTDKDHIVIHWVWVHKNHQNNGCIPELVRLMMKDEDTHDTDYVAWERFEKGRPVKWHPVHRILRHLYKIKEA